MKTSGTRDEIEVRCPKCNTVEVISGLEAWSYIILKTFYCSKCQEVVKSNKGDIK